MTTTAKINWWAVTVWGGEGNKLSDDAARAALIEYRDTGCTVGVWLADPTDADEYGVIDGVQLAECGPKREEINFDGIDDA